jgi:hypothetical protein
MCFVNNNQIHPGAEKVGVFGRYEVYEQITTSSFVSSGVELPRFTRLLNSRASKTVDFDKELVRKLLSLSPLLAQGCGCDDQNPSLSLGPKLTNNNSGFDRLNQADFISENRSTG